VAVELRGSRSSGGYRWNGDWIGGLDDEALRRRIVELTRRAELLNGKQLLTVIEEICAAGDLNDWERRPILGYLMNCLSHDHPLLVVETMMDREIGASAK
jgi:hypothetical protein